MLIVAVHAGAAAPVAISTPVSHDRADYEKAPRPGRGAQNGT
jgi:hypothetical protein